MWISAVCVSLTCLSSLSIAETVDESEIRRERAERDYWAQQQEAAVSPQILKLEKKLYTSDSGTLEPAQVPSGCISNPLPTTPGSPSYTLRGEWSSNETFQATIWRQPCQRDPSKSVVLMRVLPQNNPFICSSSFVVIQSGVQFDSVKLVNQAGGSSFCGDLFTASTFAIDQWSFDTQFNEDRAFRLIHDGFSRISEVSIPAYQVAPEEPAPSEEVIVSLEEPVSGGVYSGISNIRGFALAPQGISRVELYVNGQLATNVPYGGSRGDVASNYPEIKDSRLSGFGMTYNYSNLQTGDHTITVRAVAKDGSITEATSDFSVTRFHNSFFASNSAIQLTNASVAKQNGRIVIQSLLVDGIEYNVRLEWRRQIQGFAIVSIEPVE
jgi:hypothetical protein